MQHVVGGRITWPVSMQLFKETPSKRRYMCRKLTSSLAILAARQGRSCRPIAILGHLRLHRAIKVTDDTDAPHCRLLSR